jgi:hypothetical protein
MIDLAGRRVPVALAVVPAALVSVLLIVGGVAIGSGPDQMVATLAARARTVAVADRVKQRGRCHHPRVTQSIPALITRSHS